MALALALFVGMVMFTVALHLSDKNTHWREGLHELYPNAMALIVTQQQLRDVFDGKVVVVTGASTGIGKAFADIGRAYGAQVIGVSRTGKSNTEPLDITSAQDDITQFFAKVYESHGPIDIVFQNAGRGFVGTVLNADLDAVREVIEVNTLGSLKVLRASVPHMAPGGMFVQNSSVASQWSDATQFAYCWSKVCNEYMRSGFMREQELRKGTPNIKYVSVLPGSVATQLPANLILGESREALAAQSEAFVGPLDNMSSFMARHGLKAEDAGLGVARAVAHAHSSSIQEHRFIVCADWEEAAFLDRVHDTQTRPPYEWASQGAKYTSIAKQNT